MRRETAPCLAYTHHDFPLAGPKRWITLRIGVDWLEF
jgi:hypothetical protein